MEVLCSYTRKQKPTVEGEHERLKQDIQVVLTVIGRRSEEQLKIEGGNQYIDFQLSHLKGANLHHANLSNAALSGVNLNDATLIGVNLEDANLVRANLKKVVGLNQDMLDCTKHKQGQESPILESAICVSTD